VDRNVFFHIGLYKTATSWFQRQLFPSLEGVMLIHAKPFDRIAERLEAARFNDPSRTLIVTDEKLSETIAQKRVPGGGLAKLAGNLELIGAIAPHRGIIIGFREHTSWLQAAYGQRAKKNFGMSRASYLNAFTVEDLTWCRKLALIEQSCSSVFPFLFEELARDPKTLINDMCQFLGKVPPPNLDQLLGARENPTPRSGVGQFVSRALLFAIPSNQKRMKHRAYDFAAGLDRYFPVRPFVLPSEMAGNLRRDWDELLVRVGERRGRDFSAFRKE
jgi:hypothetical protein